MPESENVGGRIARGELGPCRQHVAPRVFMLGSVGVEGKVVSSQEA